MSTPISRRAFVLATAGFLAACGSSTPRSTSSDPTDPTGSDPSDPPGSVPDTDGATPTAFVRVPDREPAASVPTDIGSAVAGFGQDVFARLVETVGADANVTYSPLSVAYALALLEPGTVGEARVQLEELLRIDDAEAFRSGMNALERSLESREPADTGAGADGEEDPGEVAVRLADAAYFQQGYDFAADYLDAIGRNYGPVVAEADFAADPAAVAADINRFVAEATDDRITDLLAPDAVDPATVLALVNALSLRASWESRFDAERTEDTDFTVAGGGTVTVPMMHGQSTASASGDGWVGATRNYVGGLAAQFVLPDDGRFDDVRPSLTDAFDALSARSGNGADFAMPRFETRLNTALGDALRAAGLTAPFAPGGLTGVSGDERLVVDSVLHEAFVAFDEDGTEAAAATVVLMMPVSAPIDPVPVVLDRPFYYRIVDRESGATLFLGQVTDPTA